MPLYQIIDSECPAHVIARDYADAVEKWKKNLAEEDGTPLTEVVKEPEAIVFVCGDSELIL